MIFVARTAVITGDVTILEGASIWHQAVLRGDLDAIRIGRDSNIQDGAVVHNDQGNPARIGAKVTAGHGAIIHGCAVEDRCLIGMGAVLNSRVRVGTGSVIASGAVLPERAVYPDHSVIAGVPAKRIAKVSPRLEERIDFGWKLYKELARLSLPSKTPMKGNKAKRLASRVGLEFTKI